MSPSPPEIRGDRPGPGGGRGRRASVQLVIDELRRRADAQRRFERRPPASLDHTIAELEAELDALDRDRAPD